MVSPLRSPWIRQRLMMMKLCFLLTIFFAANAAAWQVAKVERREALGLIPICTAAAAVSSTWNGNSRSPSSMTISDAVAWMDEFCDRQLLSAVVASDYKFLYRGIPPGGSGVISVRSERADLLETATYNDSEAFRFFTKLEETMKDFPVKPSEGHLASSSQTEASRWGEAASIWPVRGTEFAWFQDNGLFYPRESQWDAESIICNGRKCGTDSLDDALLATNAEVLFSAMPFLAIPASLDQQLRSALEKSFLL